MATTTTKTVPPSLQSLPFSPSPAAQEAAGATRRPSGPLTREEIAQRFPEAAAWCTGLRQHFGPAPKLSYARNAAGVELGRPIAGPTLPAWLLLAIGNPPTAARERGDRGAQSQLFTSTNVGAAESSPGAPAP